MYFIPYGSDFFSDGQSETCQVSMNHVQGGQGYVQLTSAWQITQDIMCSLRPAISHTQGSHSFAMTEILKATLSSLQYVIRTTCL